MILWILISILTAMADEVVIQSTKSNSFEYQKYLQDHPEQKSFTDHYFSQISRNKSLENHLKKAQFEFLKGSLEKAKREFKEITEMQFHEDWNKEQRKIINYSFLRFAQLLQNKSEQMAVLKRAIMFDPTYNVDKVLFPPPLVKKHVELKSNLNIQVWALPERSKKYDILLINGQREEFSSGFIKRPLGPMRISFISNKWLPLTYTLNINEMEELKLALIPMVKGSCHNPTFTTKNHLQKSPLVFEKGCLGKVQPQLAKLPEEEITKAPSHVSKGKSKFYKSKWFWIGVSVVAVGLTAYQLNEQNRGGYTPAPQSPETGSSNEPVVFSNR